MSTVTWLHLSDLHARLRNDWDSAQIINALVNDFKALQKDRNLRPDFIFFTGDAAYGAANGEKMADQYSRVRAFLEAARNAFSPPVPLRDIYVVPGNHDVDRGEITPDQMAWLRSSNRTASEIVSAIADGKKQWRAWMDRLGSYRNFLTSCGLLHLKPDDPHLIWADAKEVAGVRVGIAGLNSAWSCADNQDKGKLWCGGDWQIAQLKQRMGPVAFSFALIHHPANWFTDREDPAVMRRMRQEFQVVLHGHEHQDWIEVDVDGRMVVSSGACYDSSWMPNGYSFGQIDIEHSKGGIHLRRWDNSGRGWVDRDVAGRTHQGVWPLHHLPWISERSSISESPQEEETSAIDNRESRIDQTAEEFFTRRYCQHVVDQYDVLELFGCDIPRELQRHQLSVAYVSLNLSTEAEEEASEAVHLAHDGDKPQEGAGESSAGIEYVLDDIAENTNRLIIRGPAGAGKSTLLRWCAIYSASEVLSGPPIFAKLAHLSGEAEEIHEWNYFKDVNASGIPASWRWKIPILIRLRDVPDGKLPCANDLPRFLAKHLPSAPAGWMTGVLDSGRALVLLDGVDEVHRDQRPQLADEICELIRTYPNCTYVVTTRPGAVEPGWLDRLDFTEARVEPMSRADREEFIEKWYRSAALELKSRPRPGEDLSQTAARLKEELTDQPELGILASNPLLCAMICALYRERQERLPETPAELSEALVQMLLHRRERETPGLQDFHFLATWRALHYPQKKGLLAELAWRMVTCGGSSIDFDAARETVTGVLASTPGRNPEDAPDVLEGLIERSGILRPAGDDRIDFLHNTLKEYLAAGKFVEEGVWELLADRADDPAWQPVILFTLALAPEPFSSGIVRHLLERLPAIDQKQPKRIGSLSKSERRALGETNARSFFLVRCRGAAKRLAADLSERIDVLTARLFPPAYMHEVESLAQLGPRILVHRSEILEDPEWWFRQDARTSIRCLRLLRLIEGPRAAAILGSVRKLPSYLSLLTGEWMLASSELCDACLEWPFGMRERVWADNTRVRDLRPLSGLSELQYLSLSWTLVDDLRPIINCKELSVINLHGSRVTDLAPLRELPKLRSVYLWNTQVRDFGPLAEVEALQELTVTEVGVLKDALAAFRRKRPDVKVNPRASRIDILPDSDVADDN